MNTTWQNRLLALAVLACGLAGTTGLHGQVELVANGEPQRVFAGAGRKISLTWKNSGAGTAETEVRARMLQASSTTVAPVSDVAWKTLRILPGQTILETAIFDFPNVKAETRFIIQWRAGNRILGVTDVRAFPTNLLDELKRPVGEAALVMGVYDPQGSLKPLLKAVGFADLGDAPLEGFRGRLAVIGPIDSTNQMDPSLPAKIRALARIGVPVVWIRAPSGPRDCPEPSFYSVREGKASVIVVQPELVANPDQDPRSQRNLACFCRLALKPESARLPYMSWRQDITNESSKD